MKKEHKSMKFVADLAVTIKSLVVDSTILGLVLLIFDKTVKINNPVLKVICKIGSLFGAFIISEGVNEYYLNDSMARKFVEKRYNLFDKIVDWHVKMQKYFELKRKLKGLKG